MVATRLPTLTWEAASTFPFGNALVRRLNNLYNRTDGKTGAWNRTVMTAPLHVGAVSGASGCQLL